MKRLSILPVLPPPAKNKEGLIKWVDSFTRSITSIYRDLASIVNELAGVLTLSEGAVFDDGDATPSVRDFTAFKTGNSGATTITDFDDYVDGQVLVVIAADANTTIAHNANIKLLKGSDMALSQDKTATFIVSSDVWYQTGGQDT